MCISYYDDSEFTGFDIDRHQISESNRIISKDTKLRLSNPISLPDFQSIKYIIQDKDYKYNENDIYDEYS